MPRFSAIIPLERGNQLLVAALDGFVAQSLPASDIEILTVSREGGLGSRLARHRRLKIRTVAWPRGKHFAGAINAAAKGARGSVVAVIDPQWRPLPQLAEYCLRFHDRETRDGDALTLATSLDPACADDPLLWWLHQQQLAGLDALSPGIHTWRGLRFDAVSFKRGLLRAHPIPDAEGDDTLMRAAWAKQAPIRVFSEPVPVLSTAAASDLGLVLAREYRAAFARFRAMRASSQTFIEDVVDDRFLHPERYLLTPADQAELVGAIGSITRELVGRSPRFAVGAEAERFEILGKLYLVAVSHARSAGWSDAKARRRRSAILPTLER